MTEIRELYKQLRAGGHADLAEELLPAEDAADLLFLSWLEAQRELRFTYISGQLSWLCSLTRQQEFAVATGLSVVQLFGEAWVIEFSRPAAEAELPRVIRADGPARQDWMSEQLVRWLYEAEPGDAITIPSTLSPPYLPRF